MAHFFRLILAVLLAAFSLSSHALIAKSSYWETKGGLAGYAGDYAATGTNWVKSCDAWLAAWPNATTTVTKTNAYQTYCAFSVKSKATGQVIFENQATPTKELVDVCPANSTPVSGGCQCALGYAELGGNSCVVDNGCMTLLGLTPPNDGACTGGVCQYGYKVNAGEQATAQPYGRFCNKSCTVKGNLDFCGQYSSGVMVSGRGVCQISGSFYTGDKCTGSSEVSGPSSQGTDGGTSNDPTKVETAANPVPEKLPPGKCPGQVNGVDVVVTCGSTASNETKKENGSTKNPDGSVTNNTTTNNTTTTQTICNGNACQKITTVTSGGSGPNGTGPGSKTETTTESGTKSEMCAGSTAAACKGDDDKKPTGFGGSCAGGYKAVSEDAVINAMAEETFRQNCKVNPDEASQSVGREEAAKTGNQTGNNPNNSSVSVGAGSFDNADAIGAGAYCIADKSVTILRWTATLPFSKVCSSLDILGLALLAVSSLLATRIVARG